MQNISIVGKLGSTYGIRGWLRLYSSTEDIESIFDYQPWFLNIKGQWQQTELESWRYHNNDLVVKFTHVNDRDMAQTLTNVEIGVDRRCFPKLDNGFYWHDLIGCQMVNLEGYQLGVVTDMLETGSNDVFVVKANLNDAFGKQERLIPYLEDNVVKRVDLTTKIIEVDWDAGF